jgi:hypothetical protein
VPREEFSHHSKVVQSCLFAPIFEIPKRVEETIVLLLNTEFWEYSKAPLHIINDPVGSAHKTLETFERRISSLCSHNYTGFVPGYGKLGHCAGGCHFNALYARTAIAISPIIINTIINVYRLLLLDYL